MLKVEWFVTAVYTWQERPAGLCYVKLSDVVRFFGLFFPHTEHLYLYGNYMR